MPDRTGKSMATTELLLCPVVDTDPTRPAVLYSGHAYTAQGRESGVSLWQGRMCSTGSADARMPGKGSARQQASISHRPASIVKPSTYTPSAGGAGIMSPVQNLVTLKLSHTVSRGTPCLRA